MKKAVILVVLGLTLALVVGAPPATAESDTTCVGTLAFGTFDNVVVPPSQSCTLFFVTVEGNVTALQNSRLFIEGFSTVVGNVIGDKAEVVQLGNTAPVTVGGDIEIREGETNDLAQDVFIEQTTVETGNIQVEDMNGDILIRRFNDVQKGDIQVVDNFVPMGATFAIQNNTIAEDLQVFKNKGPGDKSVEVNTGLGNLQCFENDLPFDGTPNNYPQGQEEGQCPA